MEKHGYAQPETQVTHHTKGVTTLFLVSAKLVSKVLINLKWYQMTMKLPIVHLYADRLNGILCCCALLHSTQILILYITVLIVTQSATFSFVSHFLGSSFIYSILQDNCLHKCVWKNATTAKANLVSDWKKSDTGFHAFKIGISACSWHLIFGILPTLPILFYTHQTWPSNRNFLEILAPASPSQPRKMLTI